MFSSYCSLLLSGALWLEDPHIRQIFVFAELSALRFPSESGFRFTPHGDTVIRAVAALRF